MRSEPATDDRAAGTKRAPEIEAAPILPGGLPMRGADGAA